jgi:lysozyme family protein
MKFENAFTRTVALEGNYQCDRHDRGNWTTGKVGVGKLGGTKYGISAMAYPELDIPNLTIQQAKEIYRRDWWEKLNLDRYSGMLSYQIFDASVNHGIRGAVKILQNAVGAIPDGVIGDHTISLTRRFRDEDLVMLYLGARIEYYVTLASFDQYGRGWMNRMAKNIKMVADDN